LSFKVQTKNILFAFSPVRQVSIFINGVSLVVVINGIEVTDDAGRLVVVKIVSAHG